jgi:hypothetical protein
MYSSSSTSVSSLSSTVSIESDDISFTSDEFSEPPPCKKFKTLLQNAEKYSCNNIIVETQKLNYPDSFYTINLHFLGHYAQQLEMFGPANCVTMFGFESFNKTLKDLSHGTISHENQIVSAILLKNALRDYIMSSLNSAEFSCFKNVISTLPSFTLLPNISNSTNGKSIYAIDEYRVMVKGIVFHSINYPKHQKCVNYLFCSTLGTFGKIKEFVNDNGLIYIRAALFKCYSFLEFLISDQGSVVDESVRKLYSKLRLLDNCHQFQIVEDSDIEEEIVLPINELFCRCIMVDLLIKSNHRKCLVPCIETFEKK